MKISQEELIDDLVNRTHKILNEAEELKELSEKTLRWRPALESWSVLECLEHLNLYGRFYLPEITKRLNSVKASKPNQVFKSGLLGNYFALSMLPKEKLNTMNTFKNMNPIHSTLGKDVIDEFILQQKKMLSLLEACRKIDLNKTKTFISISSFIKLKLGDTLRVVIFHNQRHMVQIDGVRFLIPSTTDSHLKLKSVRI
ncbi:DinB family protein [Owenweeksia hongkongensis]|uniref:DinB family protein n=1 Tax=Owenweeksia hongkongensis TaxID=253245 RepID=UPI003A92853C